MPLELPRFGEDEDWGPCGLVERAPREVSVTGPRGRWASHGCRWEHEREGCVSATGAAFGSCPGNRRGCPGSVQAARASMIELLD